MCTGRSNRRMVRQTIQQSAISTKWPTLQPDLQQFHHVSCDLRASGPQSQVNERKAQPCKIDGGAERARHRVGHRRMQQYRRIACRGKRKRKIGCAKRRRRAGIEPQRLHGLLRENACSFETAASVWPRKRARREKCATKMRPMRKTF